MRIFCVERERERERENLIPLLGLGSTRSGKGTDAGEESAKLAALCPEVKEGRKRERERERERYQKQHLHQHREKFQPYPSNLLHRCDRKSDKKCHN
jgi:hypothetical protein